VYCSESQKATIKGEKNNLIRHKCDYLQIFLAHNAMKKITVGYFSFKPAHVWTKPMSISVLLTITACNSITRPPTIPSGSLQNTNKKSYTASETQSSTCCFDDRKCEKSPLAATDFRTPATRPLSVYSGHVLLLRIVKYRPKLALH